MQTRVGGAAPALWRNHNFLLLWSGQGVSALGNSVTELAMPLLVLAMTGSPAQAGLIAAVGTAPNLIFGLLAGALVDRWNRKLVMILCDLIRFLTLGSVPLAYALGYLSLGQLYVVAAIQGTCFVFFGLAEFSCLPNVVPHAQITRASSLNEAAESGALFLGPGLAGIVVNLARNVRAGAALALLVDSISYLVSVASLLFIRIPFEAERDDDTATPLASQIGAGLRYLWAKNGLRIMVLTTMSIVMFTSPLYVGVIMLATSMGADAFTIGLIFSAASVGGITGAIVAPWLQERVGLGTMIISAALVPALLLPVIALATTPWVVMLAWGIIDITVPFFNIAQVSYRFSVVPDAVQGRVSSVFRMVGFGGAIVGMSLGGVLLDHIGPRPVFWIMAGGLALTAVLVSLSEIRRTVATPPAVLYGSIGWIPPAAVLRLLGQLGRSGLLRVSHRRLAGEVHLRQGQVVGAVLGAEHGVAALEGIVVALPDGEFHFEDDAEPESDGGDIVLDDLPAYLEALEGERAAMIGMIPTLQLVPRLAAYPEGGDESRIVALSRKELQLLPSLIRGLTVEAMALEHGLIDTARALAGMLKLEVATMEPREPRVSAGRPDASTPVPDLVPAPDIPREALNGPEVEYSDCC